MYAHLFNSVFLLILVIAMDASGHLIVALICTYLVMLSTFHFLIGSLDALFLLNCLSFFFFIVRRLAPLKEGPAHTTETLYY